MFQDRSGKVVKRFHVRIDAKWQGNTGTLDEHFKYSDGEKQNRVWTLTKDGNRYRGTAADVVGTAEGRTEGNALHWRYVLALPVDGKVWNVDMDDWMYLSTRARCSTGRRCRSSASALGEVTLAFRRQ